MSIWHHQRFAADEEAQQFIMAHVCATSSRTPQAWYTARQIIDEAFTLFGDRALDVEIWIH